MAAAVTTLAHQALGIVIQTAIHLLCDFVKSGNDVLDGHQRALRQRLVSMLNKLPFVCRPLIADATADVRFVHLMFYERVRMGAAGSGFFLEAVGRGLPLFTGSAPVVLPAAQMRAMTYSQVIQDRVSTIARLEGPGMRDARLASLVSQHWLHDVPPSLPGRVHVFISRARSLAQGLVAVKPCHRFAQCQNRSCNRRFYLSPLHGIEYDDDEPQENDGGDDANFAAAAPPAPPPPPAPPAAATPSGPPAPPAPQPAPPAAGSGEPTYWQLTSSAPALLHLPAAFCTWSCSQEWLLQLAAAVPSDDVVELAADERCTRSGRARVPEALRRVVKRNEQEARKMRSIAKERRRFPAVGGSEVRAERDRRIRSLNIDLGVLYAASVVAESHTLAAGKVLPGASRGWRSRPRFYAAAVRRIAALYDKHHRGDAIISNVMGHWPFLVKVRERASTIF